MAINRTENKVFSRRQLNKMLANSFDFNLLLILLFVLVFGLIMVYSASSYVALRDWSDQWHFFKRQLYADIFGLILMIVVIFIPYKLYNAKNVIRWAEFLVATLLPLLIIPFGVESHNATRWIQIPGTGFNVQPAEISKFLMILFMASWLKGVGKKLGDWKVFAFTLALPVPTCILYYAITDNLSSALIIYGICFVMTFIASKEYKRYIFIMLGILLAAVIVILVVKNSDTTGSRFRIGRVSAWLDPESSSDTTGHQIIQGLYAIGNGGLFGKGLGQSVQKLSNLPEPHNDMIFAIICEELGLVGAIAVIFMFGLMLSKMFIIAKNTRDQYGFLLVVGVMSHIAIQAVLNIAVATNTIPNTGVSLPFISYGGSSALFLIVEMGLVFAVNRSNQNEASM